jgi:hypothetical protein
VISGRFLFVYEQIPGFLSSRVIDCREKRLLGFIAVAQLAMVAFGQDAWTMGTQVAKVPKRLLSAESPAWS